MDGKKPGILDGFTRADDTLLDISRSLVDIKDCIRNREDRDTKIYFFLIPNDGGERTFAVGTTKIDFKQGRITNPNNTTELLKTGLNAYVNADWLHSLTIKSNQNIKYRIQTFDTRTLYANYAARIPYITYDTLSITCTTSTDISIFACTNPSAVVDEFSVISGMEQTNIGEDVLEAQTWDATLINLKTNMNRIRYMITAITNETWGTCTNPLTAFTLKSLFNANTILYATTNNTPVALTLDEQRILGRITGGNITGLTAAQIRTFINVANGATAYPGVGEQAFLDADHTKLNGIEDSATADQTKADIDALEIDAGTVDDKNPGSANGLATLDASSLLVQSLNADKISAGDLVAARMSTNIVSAITGLDPTLTSLQFDAYSAISRTVTNSLLVLYGGTLTSTEGATIGLYGRNQGTTLGGVVNIELCYDPTYGNNPFFRIQKHDIIASTWTEIFKVNKEGNVTILGTVDGRDVATDGTKLDGIATGATLYPSAGEQAFLDADHTKLNGIETGATLYPSAGEQAFLDADHTKLNGIATGATLYPSAGEQAFLDADHTKLNGIETGATVGMGIGGFEGSDYTKAVSDNLRHSHDAAASTSETTYTLLKTITLTNGIKGVLRCKFDLKVAAGIHVGYGRIYKNGSWIGAEQIEAADDTYVEKAEDIDFGTVNKGDSIRLYAHSDDGSLCSVRNFRLYYDNASDPIAVAASNS